MDRPLLAAMAATALGLLALGFLSRGALAPTRSLDDLAGREGQWVCVEGGLAQLRPTPSGGSRFVLASDDRSLHGWAPFPLPAVPGDVVRICGVLERDGGASRISPERTDDVEVVRAWDADAVPLSRIAQAPWEHVGRNVVVRGEFDRDGPHLYLLDPATSSRVRAWSPDATPMLVAVEVLGELVYDPTTTSFHLRIDGVAIQAGP